MMEDYLGQATDIILGQDFLTWLWYTSETKNGVFTTSDGLDFGLYMEQRVSVQGGEGESLETASVSGPMSELREARLGLTTGKKVTKALLRLEVNEDAWQVVLKAEDFSLNSLKTPAVDTSDKDDDDPDGAFLEKMYLVERCLTLLDEVYAQFLALRFGPEWPEEVKGVRYWLEKQI